MNGVANVAVYAVGFITTVAMLVAAVAASPFGSKDEGRRWEGVV